jgi:hypothetical protein
MQKFELTCQRIFVVVLILIFLPLLVTFSFIALLLAFSDLPDWLVISSIFAMMGLNIALVLWAIKRLATIPCDVYLGPEKIRIHIRRPSIIFGRSDYESAWDKLENVSSNYEPRTEKRFYKITFTNPRITISIDSPEKVSPSEETLFGESLMKYVTSYNEETPADKPRIDTTNFYESTWAKVFTYIMWAALAVFTIVFIAIPDTMDGWRFGQFATGMGIWLAAYYINRSRKK